MAALAERYDEPWLFEGFWSFQKDGPLAYEARSCSIYVYLYNIIYIPKEPTTHKNVGFLEKTWFFLKILKKPGFSKKPIFLIYWDYGYQHIS